MPKRANLDELGALPGAKTQHDDLAGGTGIALIEQ